MAALRISDHAIKAIREDADLYAAVCKATGNAPTYLPVLLRNRDEKLTNLSVLQIISEHTGIPVENLTEGTYAEDTAA